MPRPITSRALKSVMDTLRPFVPGSSVLDLFAGRGRVGIALLNMGASETTFVESDRHLCREISKETKGKAHVKCMDVFKFRSRDKFDIVFADPPFSRWSDTFAEKLFSAVASLLGEDSIFLLKCPKKMVPSPEISGFNFWKESVFGESKLVYLRYGKPKSSGHKERTKSDLPGNV